MSSTTRFVTVVIATWLATSSAARGDDGPPPALARFGTTFSIHELEARGLDWRDALRVAREVGLDTLRVGVCWSDAEPREGELEWRETDELLEEAARRGLHVVLSVGMKAPRWPEFYVPGWAAPRTHRGHGEEVSRDPELRARVLRFVRAAVDHLRRARAITHWQVENEPMDRSGPDGWWIGADLVREEAALVRSLDPRPLVVNVWCEDQRLSSGFTQRDYALEDALAIADVVGLDVYPAAGSDPRSNRWGYERRAIELPKEYRARALAAGKEAWITECQAERWGDWAPTVDDATWLIDQERRLGYDSILLWGFEWWYELGHRPGATPEERAQGEAFLGVVKRAGEAGRPARPAPPAPTSRCVGRGLVGALEGR